MKKTELLFFGGVLAVVVLVLAAAPQVDAVRARGGFDTLAQLIQQIDDNIQATHRVTVAHFKKQSKRCNDSLDDLSLQIEAKKQILRAANETMQKAIANIAELDSQIQPLKKVIVVDRLDLSRVQSKLDAGQKEREEEQQLNMAKLKDTSTIISVVNRVLAALSPATESSEASESTAAAQFQFAELMQGAAASVQDTVVAGLLASAMNTIRNTEKTPENMDRLRKLLQLLVTELEKYKLEIDNQEKVAVSQWTPVMDALGKKKYEAETKLNKHLDSMSELDKQVSANNKTAEESKEILFQGPVAHQLKHLQNQYDSRRTICDTLSSNFAAEDAQRANQNTTISALTQIVNNQKDNRQSIDGIDDVIVPRPLGCCRICQGDFVACGDQCVNREQAASLKCSRGCACEMDDPRMAAAGNLDTNEILGKQ